MIKKKNLKIASLFLVFVLMLNVVSLDVFAQSEPEVELNSLSVAKEYLETYKVEETNEMGKDFTVEYEFDSEEDLNLAAEFIVENGLEVFNELVDSKIKEVVEQETPLQTQNTRAANPLSATVTISNTTGTKKVETDIFGLANFDTLGSVEYILTLSYNVSVSGGQIKSVSGEKLSKVHFSGGGDLGDYTIPKGCSTTGASATANYYITKSIGIDIGGFGFTIKTEQTQDWFVLYAYLE